MATIIWSRHAMALSPTGNRRDRITAFNIELAPRNVFSEFVIIYTAIGCECNCYYLCRFLGKTEVLILSESRQLPP